MARVRNGADATCETLATLGIEHVFGVPGTQSIDLWEALRRRESPKVIVASNELAATFMANGYARASERVGVVITIPGPGFTYALTGIAEALLDSAPIVHIVGAPATREDGGYALQALAQTEIVAPLVKSVISVASAEEIAPALGEALSLATSGEPGPVVVQIPEAALRNSARLGPDVAPAEARSKPLDSETDSAAERLAIARRPVVLCGQGALGSAGLVRLLAETLPAPILTTTSGRGVIPESHPWSLSFDSPGAPATVVNQLLEASDLILALGAKFSHNGSLGFTLRLPPDRLIRVDASSEALARSYPASLAIETDTRAFLGMLKHSLAGRSGSEWREEEIAAWRTKLAAASAIDEPRLAGHTAAAVFAALRGAMSDTSVLVTDSGLHQYLVRRHLPVLTPRTLLVPANLQSMGFGLPAAVGAALVTGKAAVAVIGDGGFAIGGLELASAVRYKIPLVAVVLVDHSFGLIRVQQLRRTGHTSGVDLPAIDLRLVAEAVGARYERLERDNLDSIFVSALESGQVSLVEVPVETGWGLSRARSEGLVRSAVGTVLGPGATERLADRTRRRRA